MRARPIAGLIALAALAALLTAACGGSSGGGAPRVESTDASIETLAALQQENGAATGISVSGQGVAVAVPDVASLALGVSSRAATARQARDDAAASMTDLIASLKSNGIADKDFHTTQFSIDPEIDYRSSGEQVILGYRVTSMLAVTVRELDRVGEVIDDAVDAVGDAIRVQGVSFSIEDPAALQNEARALAMADARVKAEQLAELAGVQLGKPVAISESSGGGLPPILFHGDGDLRDETPISPGQLEISVNVQISYTIS